MKLWLKGLLQKVCKGVLIRWFPWQYDLGAKIQEGRRIFCIWESNETGRLQAWDRFEKDWNRQRLREKFLGKKIMGWLRKTGDRYFYPKVLPT